MIASLQTTDQLITIEVNGTVDREDWQQVAEAVNEALRQHDHVAILADLTHLDTFTAGALYEDTKLGIQNLGVMDRFDKIALVTEKNWIERAAELGEQLVPGVEVRAFASGDTPQARQWVIG